MEGLSTGQRLFPGIEFVHAWHTQLLDPNITDDNLN